jgi:hypothetical protein
MVHTCSLSSSGGRYQIGSPLCLGIGCHLSLGHKRPCSLLQYTKQTQIKQQWLTYATGSQCWIIQKQNVSSKFCNTTEAFQPQGCGFRWKGNFQSKGSNTVNDHSSQYIKKLLFLHSITTTCTYKYKALESLFQHFVN